MSKGTVASRRSFFVGAGALASAPIAAAAAYGLDGDHRTGTEIERRLAELEDLNAIRALEQDFVHRLGARGQSGAGLQSGRGVDSSTGNLCVDPAGAGASEEPISSVVPDVAAGSHGITVAPDGRSAVSTTPCSVELDTPLAPDCTLVEMARQQGEGYVRSSEHRVLVNEYVKVQGLWKRRRSSWLPA